MLRSDLPSGNEAFRQAVYAGDIFRVIATPESQYLRARIWSAVKSICGDDACNVHSHIEYTELFPRLTDLRRQLLDDAEYAAAMRSVLAGIGFAPADLAVDYLRLRCVYHEGHQSPAAAAAYAAHRDTWFANPQAQINFWIPLHDVTPEQTFRFLPAYFNRAVPNTSGDFDYAEWISATGWQGTKLKPGGGPRKKPEYPRLQSGAEVKDPQAFSFAAAAGDIIVFSAAHLHQTQPNASGRTRFSLDFRIVHRADHTAGLGAPNVDNSSQPHALADYTA